MEINEIEIIKKCQAGNLQDFALLYDTYIDKIYSFIYYRTQHKESAEDLTSRVFMKALEKINTFDTEQGYFSAWLYRIARNSVIDHYRAKKNEVDIADIWDLSDGQDIERDIDTREKLKNVDAYLKTLKSEQREIIIMRVWQGMSYQEIAKVLGKSEASCKMTYSRALAKLKQEMPLSALILFILTKI
ncbi:MAG: RNA polymerase sigma factor [Candidatus Magasanikbacteria bacterium]|nr:RNA polymerase sigma factor [Candidatus Magasanikbacteria bacterium]